VPAPIQAALLGILQGLTEFLPVSSTAHLLVAARVLGFDDPGSVFTEMIQLGSILAVMWLYRDRLAALVRGLLAGDPPSRRFVLMLLIAFLPAAAAGAVAADYVESVLHRSLPVIAVAFILGGIVMLAVERAAMRPTVTRVEDTSMGQAFGIGLAQVTALVPGVSRSGATIVGGLVAGLERGTAAEFSFFLAMPTMIAAFAHSALEFRDQITPERTLELVIGFVAAFVAAVLVVRPFLAVVRRSGFAPFAWYRIAAGLVLLALSWRGAL
jgi:undecaprenyl-diphosphatase